MTTRQALKFLRISRNGLYRLQDQGLVKCTKVRNRADWDEASLRTHLGLDTVPARTVIYARVEPTEGLAPPAQRLAEQKERLLVWAEAKGIKIDLVLGESRRSNHFYHTGHDSSACLATLIQMIVERQLTKLIIESRDRLVVGVSWEFFHLLCQRHGVEVLVVNSIWPTAEFRAESKNWLTDALTLYKIMNGEISDKTMLENFMAGVDLHLGKKTLRAIEQREAGAKKESDRIKKHGYRSQRKPIDLDEVF